LAAGGCEFIWTHREAKTFEQWPGVKKGRKEAMSHQQQQQKNPSRTGLKFCRKYRDL